MTAEQMCECGHPHWHHYYPGAKRCITPGGCDAECQKLQVVEE